VFVIALNAIPRDVDPVSPMLNGKVIRSGLALNDQAYREV